MHAPFSITLDPPFLLATFDADQHVVSWSMLRPGFHVVRRVAWLEVRNADLPRDVDPVEVIRTKVTAAALDDAVVLVTSRNIHRYRLAHSRVEDCAAHCLTTVGLSNSERVGERLHQPPPFAGTINTLVHISQPLSESALLEAVSIATEARTAAILDAGIERGGRTVTGTGTDCVAIAAPLGTTQSCYAGKHTAIGEAIGAAVYRATAQGVSDWKIEFSASPLTTRAKAVT